MDTLRGALERFSDPEAYERWRHEHLRQMDEDYRQWRRERFAAEFQRWRDRQGQAVQAGSDEFGEAVVPPGGARELSPLGALAPLGATSLIRPDEEQAPVYSGSGPSAAV